MMIQRGETLRTDSCDNWDLKYNQRAIVLSLFPSIVILDAPKMKMLAWAFHCCM